MSGFFGGNKESADSDTGATETQKALSGPNDAAKGVGGEDIYDTAPRRINTPGEYIINNQNSWIVLGYDREGSFLSGQGGKGALNSSAIEITCGYMANTKKGPDSDYKTDPSWCNDAAKIYISQRSNIDKYMQMPYDKETTTYDFTERSAIGIQADHIRIVGREGIKIVTGAPERCKGAGFFGVRNSVQGKRYTASGIELIAGFKDGTEKIVDLGQFPPINEQDSIQPIPRGIALAAALDELSNQVVNGFEVMMLFAAAQLELNGALMTHVHPFVPLSGITTPSPDLAGAAIKAIVDQLTNSILPAFTYSVNVGLNFKWNYLFDFSPYYICSRYNFTN